LADAGAQRAPQHRRTLGVVMTMGALHAGHRELIRFSRSQCDLTLVTVFLNPLQFGPHEDLSRYPRTLEADMSLCRDESVDVVFAPTAEEVYPRGTPTVRVAAGPLGDVLEGASRPGHFDGVLTVVAKLLHLTMPDIAYYGQKDAQQLLLIRRMVSDLDFPVAVEAVPTVRDPDGLALSSRNAYLTASDRITALTLSRALRAGADAAPEGAAAVRQTALACLERVPELGLDYLVLVDPERLVDVPHDHVGHALLAVAARVGSTRLIDNELVLIPDLGRGSRPSD
jgi:pantoate--beta-alanine ligase